MRFGDIPWIGPEALLERHALVLLDAYGVLHDAGGPLPGARALVDELNRRTQAWFVLTNGASRLESSCARRFARYGLAVGEERVITSASLLGLHFERHGLRGARCVVLGTDESREAVRRAGGEVLPPAEDAEAEALVICDEEGYAVHAALDAVLTMLVRALDGGRVPHLVLANPDLIYLKAEGRVGITAGSLALVVEEALALRYPGAAPRFLRLGKPYAPMFEEALRRAGTRDAVMVGDQLQTDVRGANAAGIASALVLTGVTRLSDEAELQHDVPTYRLALAGA